MCQYAIVSNKGLIKCDYTKKLCTLCILGNGKTYKEAEQALKGDHK